MHLAVLERHDEADGVVSLTLVDPDGGELPAWTPGAHVDLVLGDDLVRQYSLSSDPRERRRWRLGVLREPAGRGGSQYVHDELLPGSLVEVSHPRNHFELEPSARYLFVAGGIGITPVLAMIKQAEASGADWSLVYGGRSRRSMAFLDELTAYGDRVTLAPQDEVGLLALAELLADVRLGTLVYACGPEPLLAALEQHIAHWPTGSLHLERFAPKPVEIVGPDEVFDVEFASSGVTVSVPPGRSILSVAEEAGVAAASSCSEGTCGTCETTILEGRADHRDSLLTEDEQEENATMMICVSRAERGCARLRLDL